MAGGMAQGVGSEFKSQPHKKKVAKILQKWWILSIIFFNTT
jgi:hypothetical protein